jgi:hypothetical protein
VSERQRAVQAWCARDHAHALLPADHEAVETTIGVREVVVERLLASAPDADLFHACATLGRIIAERGGSPTLASWTIDGVREALGNEGPWLAPARAAVAEGYAAARAEMAQREARGAWEWPRCSVPIDDATVAIAASHPDDDADALAAWAGRVANAAALAGVRRVVVAGSEPARQALAEALDVVGIVRLPSPAQRR